MEEGGVLLDIVSVLFRSVPSYPPSSACSTPERTLATDLEGALDSLATPGYVLLAREFHVSVDEIASTFSASVLGLAVFTYVDQGSPMMCVRPD